MVLIQGVFRIVFSRKGSSHQGHTETPDVDYRPSEIVKKFKDVYTNEWADAYDEICKDFGSEKTVKHLLWIVTVHISLIY